MTTRIGIVASSAILAAAALAILYLLRLDRTVVQPKIFVSSSVGTVSQFSFAPETCPKGVFVYDNKQGEDYDLSLFWGSSGWSVIAERKDGVLLINADDPAYRSADFKVLLRRACNVVMQDAELWARDQLHPKAPGNSERQAQDENRFELGDARNGPKVTTAIIDKRTGRVWLWTQLHDNNGKETDSEFLEEDVTPKPDVQ